MWQRVLDLIKFSKSRSITAMSSMQSAVQSAVKSKSQMDVIFWVCMALFLLVMLGWLIYQADSNTTLRATKTEVAPLKLEVAASTLDAEKMWRNYFEEKLIKNKEAADDKLQVMENNMTEQSSSYQQQLKEEMSKLKAQMKFITDEHESTKRELHATQAKAMQVTNDATVAERDVRIDSNVVVNHMGRNAHFDIPKSSRNYIPETAYVKGILLGGISVSTAIGSSAEPVPVIIRVTDRGNLPKNFDIDLTNCQIMGSSYGDLSSERAVVRAEVLSCRDPLTELVHTTKIVGLAYGDDGMNGIKGKVIQTSGRHLQNAIIGGMISGFANSTKGQDQFTINGLGVNTKNKGMGDLAREGSFNGAANAAEKIADYYIKQAEAMSPVLMVSGGAKIDIVFTKGVTLNSLDVQEKLDQLRAEKATP